MSRPENKENKMSLADQIVWALETYGPTRGVMATTRPTNRENMMSLADQIVWAITS